MPACCPNIAVNVPVMGAAAEKGFLNATDLADYLVVPWHALQAGPLRVRKGRGLCIGTGGTWMIHELSLTDFKTFSPLIEADIFEFLSTEKMISRRITHGGTGYDNVKKAVETAQKRASGIEPHGASETMALRWGSLVLFIMAAVAGCGKKGPPLPPA